MGADYATRTMRTDAPDLRLLARRASYPVILREINSYIVSCEIIFTSRDFLIFNRNQRSVHLFPQITDQSELDKQPMRSERSLSVVLN
jgi:hypothetical protein